MEPSFEYLYFLGALKEKILIMKYSENHIVCIKLIKRHIVVMVEFLKR